jgi:hypothetical protein
LKKTGAVVLNICLLLVVTAVLFLNSEGFQKQLLHKVAQDFNHRTGYTLQIDKSSFNLLRGLSLHVIRIEDKQKKAILRAERMDFGLELLPLLEQEIKLRNIRLIRANLRLERESKEKPLNIDPILKAYASKEKKSKKNWDIEVESFVLRDCKLTYDVKDELNPIGKLNFDHLQLNNLSAKVSYRQLAAGNTRLIVSKLSTNEKSGLNIHLLSLDGIVSSESIRIRNLYLASGDNHLSLPVLQIDLKRHNNKQTDWNLKPFNFKAKVRLSDFAFLVSTFSDFKQRIDITAQLKGNLNELICNKISVRSDNGITLDGSFHLAHLNKPSNLTVEAKIGKAHLSAEGLKQISGILLSKPVPPKVFEIAGSIDYSGDLHISPRKTILKGELRAAAGNLKTDIELDRLAETTNFKGQLSSSTIRIHSMTAQNGLIGEAGFNLQVKGNIHPTNGVSGVVSGDVNNIQYSGYNIRELRLNGRFDKKHFEGLASLRDENGFLDFKGLVVWAGQKPAYEFDLYAKDLNLLALGMLKNQKIEQTSFHLHTDMEGKELDNITGTLSIDSLEIQSDENRFFLPQLTLHVERTFSNRSISVNSDILKAEMWGNFKLLSLPDDFKGTLNHFMPSLLRFDYKPAVGTDFHFQATISPSPELFKLFKLPIQLNEDFELQGFINQPTNKFRIRGTCSDITYNKNNLVDAGFLLENPQNEAKFIAYAQLGKGEDPVKVNVDVRGLNDVASFKLNMSNQGLQTISGNISGGLHFFKGGNGQIAVDGSLNASNLIVKDSSWNIMPSTWKWNNKTLLINNFQLSHRDQFVKINGLASARENDTIRVSLNKFGLDNIFNLMRKGGVRLGGDITGEASLSKMFGKISLDADLSVANFSLNNEKLGNLKATSKWNPDLRALVLDARIVTDAATTEQQKQVATGKGYYYPGKDSMNLSLDAQHLSLGFLEPYLGDVLNDLDGKATGNIVIQGPMKRLSIYSKAYVENGSFGIKMLNTRYTFSDTIWVTPNIIYFRNTRVRDKEGNQAIANGTIRHKRFKGIKTAIEIVGNNILCMDIPANPDSYFYGAAYGSGEILINGENKETVIDVNLKTERNTKVTISFLKNKEVADAGFMQFVNKQPILLDDEVANFGKKTTTSVIKKETESKLTVNLQIDATPDAQLTLVTDPSSGDDITGVGTGSIRCVFANNADIALYGRYNIQKGKYKFIYQNIMRRDFTLQEGGNITFAGNPFAAKIDITAAYTVNAQLSDLLSTDVLASLNLNRTAIPVNCELKLDGELQHPGIHMGLTYPSADDDLVRSINDIINTEDAINQQLVFLMLFGRFSTPTTSSAQNSTSGNSMSTVLNTGISTLSSQFNNIVNGVLGEANMNFNFNYKNSTYDATTPGEWGVMIGGNFFNNRLTLNSNLGSRENLVQNEGGSQFIGEFDANVKFKNSQKWSWKFFNRANDNRYFKSALNTQGAGILFKQDYNSLFDLFSSKKKKETLVPPSRLDTSGKPDQ